MSLHQLRAGILLGLVSLAQVAAVEAHAAGDARTSSVAPDAARTSKPKTAEDSFKQMNQFITDTAAMAGAVSTCDPGEEEKILMCSSLILNNWSKLTGLPSIDTPAMRKATRIGWSREEFKARDIQEHHSQISCKAILDNEANSVLWRVCTHGASTGRTSIDSTPTTLKLQ